MSDAVARENLTARRGGRKIASAVCPPPASPLAVQREHTSAAKCCRCCCSSSPLNEVFQQPFIIVHLEVVKETLLIANQFVLRLQRLSDGRTCVRLAKTRLNKSVITQTEEWAHAHFNALKLNRLGTVCFENCISLRSR